MRLVIHSQGAAHAGLRRYNGQGIFSSIGRKLFSFGLKKVINAVQKDNKNQKIAKTVLSEPPLIHQNKEKGAKQQRKNRKRKLSPLSTAPLPKKRKYSEKRTNQLMNRGSGIVLD